MDTRKIKNIRHNAVKMEKVVNDKSTVWKRTITYKIVWSGYREVPYPEYSQNRYKSYQLEQDGTVVGIDPMDYDEIWYDYYYVLPYGTSRSKSIERWKYSRWEEYINPGGGKSRQHYLYRWTGTIVEE